MYFGSDSGSDGGPQNPCASGTQFYIGKIGENLTAGATSYFNYTLAHQLLQTPGNMVYGYWFVHGPNDSEASKYSSLYAYGQAQADLALGNRATMARYGNLNGLTVFADIEHHPTWNLNDQAANQQVINGFLSRSTSFGIYTGPCAWLDITGSVTWQPTFASGANPVLWTEHYSYGSSPPACGQIAWGTALNATCGSTQKAAQGVASLTPTIWQYAQDVNVSGTLCDWDVASSLPA